MLSLSVVSQCCHGNPRICYPGAGTTIPEELAESNGEVKAIMHMQLHHLIGCDSSNPNVSIIMTCDILDRMNDVMFARIITDA